MDRGQLDEFRGDGRRPQTDSIGGMFHADQQKAASYVNMQKAVINAKRECVRKKANVVINVIWERILANFFWKVPALSQKTVDLLFAEEAVKQRKFGENVLILLLI